MFPDPHPASRPINGVITTDLARTLDDLRRVVDRLSDFCAPDDTRLWLHARHPLLKAERAIDLMNNERTNEVLAVIERLEAGTYI